MCARVLPNLPARFLIKDGKSLTCKSLLAVTEENTWQWLSIGTETPEECMHEVLKRDASSGVMERGQDGVSARDWQGCSHRMFLWRPLAYDTAMSDDRMVYGRCACLPASTVSSSFAAASTVREAQCVFPGAEPDELSDLLALEHCM